MAALSAEQQSVLRILYDDTDAFGENCLYFRTIAKQTELDLEVAARAARSLKADGLAQYRRGLFTEDGRCAGAGYAITAQGVGVMAEILRAEGAVP